MCEIDRNRLEKMKYDILQLENENLKTNEYKYSEMVERIRKIIIDGVRDINF